MPARIEPAIRIHRLWWLPMLAGLLPLVATAVAFQIAVRLGLIEGCNPFIDGCVSISRAARHGLPNIVFRGLVLPAAALQALAWLLCVPWLYTLGATPDRLLRALPWAGVIGALSLVLYGTFLGTEGDAYRWVRRTGVAFYFGFTCIGMLIVSGEVQRRMRAGRRQRQVGTTMLALLATVPLLGLAYVLLPLVLEPQAAHDALQNTMEWWVGVIFTLFFFVLAWGWRSTRFGVGFESRPTG